MKFCEPVKLGIKVNGRWKEVTQIAVETRDGWEKVTDTKYYGTAKIVEGEPRCSFASTIHGRAHIWYRAVKGR